MPKPDFERYRNDVKKAHEDEQDVDEHQMPDHPSNFMKMIKGRSQAISAAKEMRRQVLPSRFSWDGSIDHFEVFRNNVDVIMDRLVQTTSLMRVFRLHT